MFPQQNHCATEQQKRHLKDINYFPCFLQSVDWAGQQEGQINYLGSYFYYDLPSFIAYAQLFLPPK